MLESRPNRRHDGARMKGLIIKNNFSKHARGLRKQFTDRFSDSASATSSRFVWDCWNHENTYYHLRTPATSFFKKQTYLSFHRELIMWGRRHLGCWDISPPWLSCYLSGHFQKWHTDIPHGPWAFVFSLTEKKLKGGDTEILNPKILSYWRNFGSLDHISESGIIQKIPPLFNRLIVFDPRLPHQVSEVKEAINLQESRLVIHGWFTEPKTYIEGSLAPQSTEKTLNECFNKVSLASDQFELMTGTISLGLQVNSKGNVEKFKFLTNNLVTLNGEPPLRFLQKVKNIYSNVTFSRSKSSSIITVPLIFQ